jgi:hypothetical protein
MKTFKKCTTEKQLLRKDFTCYKNSEKSHMKMPHQMGKKTKEQYDKKAMPHSFKIGDKVLISNDFDTTKNPKLVPNWKGPGEIIDINDTNAKIKFKNKI